MTRVDAARPGWSTPHDPGNEIAPVIEVKVGDRGRLSVSTTQPPTRFADVGLGRVAASAKAHPLREAIAGIAPRAAPLKERVRGRLPDRQGGSERSESFGGDCL